MSGEQDGVPGRVDDTSDEAAESPEDVAEPSEDERDAWARVRRSATGMRHHEAKDALDEARKAAEATSLTGREALIAQAEVEEWERIADALFDHAGVYDATDDPFVQGEAEGRAHHTSTPPDRR